MKSGDLNFLEPSGPLQACNGTVLPSPLPVLVVKIPDIPQCIPVRREERTGKIRTLMATERVLNIPVFSG
jgi:hypothetical protein